MSDDHPEYPDKFGSALRVLLATGLLTPFALKASDNISDGHYVAGAVFAGLAFLILALAVKWKRVEALATSVGGLAKSKAKLILMSLLGIVVIGAAFTLGTFVGRRQSATPAAIGNVVWNFEQTARGAGYFLSMQKVENQEIRVTGFGAHGRNDSSQPIDHFSGYLRSDLTNVQLPLFVLGQDPDESKLKVCFAQSWIPTLPQETFGIPGFADFDIVTFEKAVTLAGADGMPLAKFMNDFVPFTIFVEYGGTKYERHFSKAEVLNQVETFQRSINPQSLPRVMRRPNAKAPLLPTLQTLLPPDPPKNRPGLASPIPSVGLPKLPAD
jgi:hypothetical protein